MFVYTMLTMCTERLERASRIRRGKDQKIVSNLGVNNFEDPCVAIRECRRVARTGAVIALTTNLQGHMREFYGAFEEVLREAGDVAALDRLEAHVAHRATVPGVRDLLEDGGFTIDRVVERQGRMRFANGTALLNHHFIKLGFLDGWKNVVPGGPRRIFSLLQKKLDDDARTQETLSLSIPMAHIEATAS